METKLLDLNAYGVSELSNAEMRETNGTMGCAVYRGALRYPPLPVYVPRDTTTKHTPVMPDYGIDSIQP